MQQLKRSVTGKYDADVVDAVISQQKKEFDATTAQQKQRITELREENSRIREELGDVEEKKNVLLTAMLTAQRTSRELVETAKEQAAELIEAAEERERQIKASVENYRNMLTEVRTRCENILASIDAELQRTINIEKPPQPQVAQKVKRKVG